jgi:hypothetical protein
MTTTTDIRTAAADAAAAEAPFDAVRRRLLGTDGTITHAGNIGYTFGGGGIGVLARRYGMAASAPGFGSGIRSHTTPRHRPTTTHRPQCSPTGGAAAASRAGLH